MNTSRSPQIVCRTCLKLINENEPYTREDTSTEYGKIIDILETCVSELNLDLTYDIVLCKNCTMMLNISYSFKLTCLHTEDAVFSYLLKHNLEMSNKIHLIDMINNRRPNAGSMSNKEPHVNKKLKNEKPNDEVKDNNAIPSVFNSSKYALGNERDVKKTDLNVSNVSIKNGVSGSLDTVLMFEENEKVEEMECTEDCLKENISPLLNNSIDGLSLPSRDAYNTCVLDSGEKEYLYNLLGSSFTKLCDEDFEDVIFRSPLSEL